MTPELLAAALSALAVVMGLCGVALCVYKLGRSRTRERTDAIADMVARRWINRPFQPLAHYKNKQHWMELARRECHQLLADDLCKAFDIETPKRTVENA